MPADPNIILEAGNLNDPQKQTQGLVSMFGLAQAVKQARQQDAKQNALLKIFTDPNSIDDATGLPKPQALKGVYAADPQMGVQMQNEILAAQVKRTQVQHYKTEVGKNNFDFMSTVAGIGYNAYDSAKKAGKSEPDAISAGQAARNEAVKNNGGVIGDDLADGILGKPFEPSGALALANSNTEFARSRSEVSATERATKAEAERERHDAAMESNTQRGQNIRVETAGASKWVVQHDPKTNTDFRYNPETAQATTLDGKPYAPQGAAKESGGAAARSPAAMATQKYIAENPNATADDIANFGAKYQRTITAGTADVKAEAAGLQNLGKMKASVEQAEGNATREADLVLSLASKGTANGAPSVFNKWRQSVRTGVFNEPEVSSFQTAVESFKNEYVKVLSTTGGMAGGMSSDAARREADQYINPNLTEDQLKANVAVMKKSMANRTTAINAAYEDTKGRVAKAGSSDPRPKLLHYDVQGNLVP